MSIPDAQLIPFERGTIYHLKIKCNSYKLSKYKKLLSRGVRSYSDSKSALHLYCYMILNNFYHLYFITVGNKNILHKKESRRCFSMY